jgi:hypothetical protein
MLIYTTRGELEESTLRKVEGHVDNDHEHTTWVEYYLGDELVHRSVHVTLKEGVTLFPDVEGMA